MTLQPIRRNLILVSVVYLAFCGCNVDEEHLRRSAEAGEPSAMINYSTILLKQGRTSEAAMYLRRAASAGSKEAFLELREAAAWGSVDALDELQALYGERGQLREAMDCYYRVAKLYPMDHAFNAGIFYIFGGSGYEGEKIDRERGRECLVLAARNGDTYAHLLLVEMVADGLILPPTEGDLLLWQDKAAKATDIEKRLLHAQLASFSPDSIGRHKELWRKYLRAWEPADRK